MTDPELLIGTVAYRCDQALAECLDAVHSSTRTPFEWCVVDNAPELGQVGSIVEPFARVRLIPNRLNRGFAAGVNQAFASGASRFFLVLNPDTVVHDGAIDRMVDHLRSHPMTGLISCRIENDDRSLQHSIRRFPTVVSALMELVGCDIWYPENSITRRWNGRCEDYERTHPVDWLSGSAFMLPSSLYRSLGGLDERFFMYSEEVDLCRRVRATGREVCYLASATIQHGHAVSTRQTDVRQVEYYKSLYRYFRKNHGLPAGWLIRGAIAAWQLTLTAASLLIGLSRGRPREGYRKASPRLKLLRWCLGPDRPPRWL